MGSEGNRYDNALADTINGLYRAELIHHRAPWKMREAVELARWNRVLAQCALTHTNRLYESRGGSVPRFPETVHHPLTRNTNSASEFVLMTGFGDQKTKTRSTHSAAGF